MRNFFINLLVISAILLITADITGFWLQLAVAGSGCYFLLTGLKLVKENGK